MKRIFMLTVAVAVVCTAFAQGLTIGGKVPEFKVKEWLSGKKPGPAPNKMVLTEFFYSGNPGSVKRLETLGEWAAKYPSGLTVVIVAKEDTPEVRDMLRGSLVRCYVGFDDAGRTFEAFGVQYVPYGVLTDPKGRVMWMGNSSNMSEEVIENHIEHGIYKDRPLRKTSQGGKNR